jgi:hypothetical protein
MIHNRTIVDSFFNMKGSADPFELAQYSTDILVAMMHVTSGSPKVEVTNKPSVPPAQPPRYEFGTSLPGPFQVRRR